MLYFDRLKNLSKNITHLQKIFKEENLFLVGGSIRNILLWIEKTPIDLDTTGAGDPNTFRENINKEKYSCFRTEKYGTITVIPEKNIQYELTPFRSEDNYTDNRHPDTIERSDSIINDSKRRDFSINSFYYTQINFEIKTENKENKEYVKKETEIQLKKEGFIFFNDLNLLILSDEKLIEKLLPHGKIKTEIISYLLNTTKNVINFGTKRGKTKKLQILIDPNQWLQDLVNKKITAIGNPDKRFQEDALRIIRAARFVSVLNQKLKNLQKKKNKIELFDVEKGTRLSMKNNITLVDTIAKERIKDELTKAFAQGSGFVFTALADELWLLPILFPALANTKNNEQPVRYHPFDTYAHTLLTLYHLEKLNKNYLVRLAMLYHDVGKPEQYASYSPTPDKNEIRKILGGELNHRVSWPKIAKKEFGILGFSKKEIEEIMRYIAEHHTPWEILMARENNRIKKLRKLYSDWGFERVNNILDITIADRQGQFNPLQNSADITDVEDLRTMLVELKNKEGQFTQQEVNISGKDIMEYYELPAWPQIWKLLHKAFLRVANDIANRNEKEKILKHLKHLI